MSPSFSSIRQAGAFALLLLILLLLPAVMGPELLPSREQAYSTVWWANAAFPYIEQQIFHEKGDIDIAFIGSSRMWEGIDTPYVQQKLSEKLGRPAVVRSFCWGGDGYDALYFIAQDLLQHRKVHTLVFYDVYDETNQPNGQASSWFRFGDNAADIKDLPWNLKATYYFAAIFGMPRNLLGLLRSDLPAELYHAKKTSWEVFLNSEDVPTRLGSLASRRGFASPDGINHVPFQPFAPELHPENVVIYSALTRQEFQFAPSVSSWQFGFARKFASLAQMHGTQLIMLHIPKYKERRDAIIKERVFWPEALRSDVAIVGIPSAKLFEGMSDDQVQMLYDDAIHFNENGQVYFTSLITPTLLKLYAQPQSR
jgi:hypothetical protein